MSSTPTTVATPIRQPRGPSNTNTFTSLGPPLPDVDSLRRSNTVSTPRHQGSASISSSAIGSSAFHGGMRFKNGQSRFRSGSLSSSNVSAETLVRKGSGRAVQTQEVVIESGEEAAIPIPPTETGSGWGKGLARQSSLPSRKVFNPAPPVPPNAETVPPPPPRPPRRISNAPTNTVNTALPAHAASHSLSSLTMLQPLLSVPQNAEPGYGAGVSRTQSLRNQARHHDSSSLARSASLRSAGESARQNQQEQPIVQVVSPPIQPSTPRNPFTPPTPPPVSSTAALPPFPLTMQPASNGAELRRHQSFTQGYRANGRRGQSMGGLNMEQNLEVPEHTPRTSLDRIEAPTSPIGGRSVWSPNNGADDDGWGRSLQDNFEAMQLGKRMMEVTGQGNMAQPHAMQHNHQDEPSWVANLVGQQPDRRSPRPPSQPPRSPYRPPEWQQPQQMPYPGMGYPGQPSLKPQYQVQQPGYAPYINGPPVTPIYPSPPSTANRVDVKVLERSRGLNPVTFEVPPSMRSFIIKSFQEEDVAMSLKYGIWSSTVLGNKRLDAAFRSSAHLMPIYLFFSVNGSRMFSGMAQMMTPVDESRTTSVWAASEKWKGIFEVKWLMCRDVPNSALRHIRLMNQPEQKPVTIQRDTTEMDYQAACDMIEVFLEHQNKPGGTSLLQDESYYEQLVANRNTRPSVPSVPPQPSMPPPHTMHGYNAAQMGVPPVPSIPARW